MRVALFIATLGIGLLVFLTIVPSPGASQLAVVVPPWHPVDRAMKELIDLNVKLVRPGYGDRIVIVDTAEEPTARQRLAELGYFLMDPKVIGACAALVGNSQEGPNAAAEPSED